jgi:hypothetical protein
VVHFQTFGSGQASADREGEAGAIYNSAAYTTGISNSLVQLGRRLESLEARLVGSPVFAEELRAVRWALSDAQLSTFVVYELTASRYEILCGLQGASGVADPALLGTFLDAPAAYSSAGRQAFRRQPFNRPRRLPAAETCALVHPLPVATLLLVEAEDPLSPRLAAVVATGTGVVAAVEELPRSVPQASSSLYVFPTALRGGRPGAPRLGRNRVELMAGSAAAVWHPTSLAPLASKVEAGSRPRIWARPTRSSHAARYSGG